MQSRFDPTHSVNFDLSRGRVALDGADARLLVPTIALIALCRNAGEEAVRDFGRTLGTESGRRVADRLGRDLDGAGVDSIVEHLGGDLALIGLGSLSVERWGQALVFSVAHSPLGAEGDVLLAAVLEGALGRAVSRSVSVVPLQRDDTTVRLLAVSPAAANKVRGWLGQGVAWSEVIGRLNGSTRGQA